LRPSSDKPRRFQFVAVAGEEPVVPMDPNLILLSYCGPDHAAERLGGGGHHLAIRESERECTAEPELDGPAFVVNLVVMVRAHW
jgi:hypothetical protein